MHAKLEQTIGPLQVRAATTSDKGGSSDGGVLLRIAARVLSLVVLIIPSLAWLYRVMLDLQSCHVSDAGQQVQSRTDTDWLLL